MRGTARPDRQDRARDAGRSWRARIRAGRRLASVACVVAAAAIPATAAAGPPDRPTWSDEFTGTALDTTRWAPRASGERHDGNLTPDALSVADGALTITTYTEDDEHYSGMVSSHGSGGLQQAYGYFEARVKFNSSPGQWSAFWLQSPTIGDPLGRPETAGVEMDITEHRVRCVDAPASTPPPTCGPGSSIADRVQQGLVWDGYDPAKSQSAVRLSEPLPGLGNGSWHTWALNWAPSGLTFSFDERPIWWRSGPVSQRSQYMVLSSEVGEFFAGAIPSGGYGSRATSTTNMQVDYVRVWETPAPAPVSTDPPVASGTAAAGAVLACSSGTWSGSPEPTFEYRWLRDGSAIPGASASTYTVAPGDRDHAVACRVTAMNTGGPASAQSTAVAIPAPPPPAVLAPLSLPPLQPLTPPPPPPPDRSAPRATIVGARAQTLGPTVAVSVSCRDEPCRAAATGTVRVPRVGRGPARTYRSTAHSEIAAGTTANVRLRLSRAARAAIGRALRSRRRVTVRVDVRITDRAGNAATLSRRIAMRLPARRPAR